MPRLIIAATMRSRDDRTGDVPHAVCVQSVTSPVVAGFLDEMLTHVSRGEPEAEVYLIMDKT